MKKIMVLGASILQIPAILKAKQMNCFVIAVDMDKNAAGFRYADESLIISTNDIEQILVAAESRNIDGIISVATDMPVRSVAAVAEKLGLNGISSDTAYCATNKYQMRNRLLREKIPIPEYYLVSNKKEYYSIIKRFENGYIVKPTDNSGSRGVYLVRSKDDIDKAFSHAMQHTHNGELLVEEYMIGDELSVETISYQNEVKICAITDKITSGPPHFVEVAHSQPSRINAKLINEIEDICIRAIDALGIENGPAHTEIIITDNGPRIVEIGARLGGGFITSHLVPLSTGIDMIENSIKVALNEKPVLNTRFHKAAVIKFLTASKGIIEAISGTEKASLIKDVFEVNLFKKEGELINELESGSDRVGYVISVSNNLNEAFISCNAAVNLIKIHTAK